MTRLADLNSLPSSYNASSMMLWTHDGPSDYKISIAQLRDTFTQIGAMWYQAADQALDSTGDNRLTLGSLYYDAQNFTDTNSTGVFYIKSDKWNYVRLIANGELSNAAYGYEVKIFKNGAQFADKYNSYYDEFNAPHGFNMATGYIPVSSGDYFELNNTNETVGAGTYLASNLSWFCIMPMRL